MNQIIKILFLLKIKQYFMSFSFKMSLGFVIT